MGLLFIPSIVMLLAVRELPTANSMPWRESYKPQFLPPALHVMAVFALCPMILTAPVPASKFKCCTPMAAFCVEVTPVATAEKSPPLV